jgi:allantoate deiminase
VREKALQDIFSEITNVAKTRGLDLDIDRLPDFNVTKCAPWLSDQIERAVEAEGLPVKKLPSGAGHDGMAMCAITDIAMLFVRCKAGISHNPAESITEEDAATGARVLLRFIEDFKPRAV